MTSYYKGKVKVICQDLMCFPAHPVTMEPLACSTYDAYALSDPDHAPVETIGHGEWQRRRNALRELAELGRRMKT